MASSLQELFTQPKVTLTELSTKIDPFAESSTQPASSSVAEKVAPKVLSPEELKLREECTVFVGNLPLDTKQRELTKFFRSCGTIDAIRFRSVPTLESKLPKKAAVILKQYSNVKDTMHAYVVFKDREAVIKALELNGSIFKERHIRVDSADDSKHDYKCTVFVGNIPFTVEEEELWQRFAEFGTVKNVRIIRDNRTQQSKGVAYIMFSNKEERKKAAQAKVQISGRELRIKKATSKYKLDKKEKIRENIAKEYAEKRNTASEKEKKETEAPKKDKKREEMRKQRKIERKAQKKRKEAPPKKEAEVKGKHKKFKADTK